MGYRSRAWEITNATKNNTAEASMPRTKGEDQP